MSSNTPTQSNVPEKPYILISGASRGIGLSLVTALLEHRPHAVIFAGARDPSAAKELAEVAKKNPNVHVVPLIADDEASVKRAVEEVGKVTKKLDIVIANAGINSPFVPTHVDDIDLFKTNFSVNTLGPVYLYQATYPLLVESRKKDSATSTSPPKFFITSSAVASMGAYHTMFMNASYGVSKAGANYLALSIHHQTGDVDAVHPGLVSTDMGKISGKELGIPDNYPGVLTPDQSAAEYADLIIKSTRAEHGGKFWAQGVEGATQERIHSPSRLSTDALSEEPLPSATVCTLRAHICSQDPSLFLSAGAADVDGDKSYARFDDPDRPVILDDCGRREVFRSVAGQRK
ncbi:hypothetical protein QFC21_006668 [Naganishia friedmannii]|uniref:Uncharacterized protein n=1 Tax=Naganishia friedmannii TaxID=89922 RepID=A0ACC2V127_9TREE|nr:hypothetical protein QFC21_006668 [Naganishia friedmannii]